MSGDTQALRFFNPTTQNWEAPFGLGGAMNVALYAWSPSGLAQTQEFTNIISANNLVGVGAAANAGSRCRIVIA